MGNALGGLFNPVAILVVCAVFFVLWRGLAYRDKQLMPVRESIVSFERQIAEVAKYLRDSGDPNLENPKPQESTPESKEDVRS